MGIGEDCQVRDGGKRERKFGVIYIPLIYQYIIISFLLNRWYVVHHIKRRRENLILTDAIVDVGIGSYVTYEILKCRKMIEQ